MLEFGQFWHYGISQLSAQLKFHLSRGPEFRCLPEIRTPIRRLHVKDPGFIGLRHPPRSYEQDGTSIVAEASNGPELGGSE